MKKLITNLFLGLAIMASFHANAQYCGSSQVSWPACGVENNYGFGDYNSFQCITRGQCDSLIIPFKVYSTFTAQGQTVNVIKLKFASIDSLPCGLCWSTSTSINPNDSINEFDANESGCIKITGLTNDPAGSYLLSILIDVATSTANDTAFNPIADPINSAAGGIYLWVKVIDAGAQCPDTVDQTLLQHPSTSCTNTNCVTGINEISKTINSLTVQPNPLTNEAKVSFSSETAGTQQIWITDVLGRNVYNTTMVVKQGSNETTIRRNNMPAGVYILYIGNEQGTATKKFVIED